MLPAACLEAQHLTRAAQDWFDKKTIDVDPAHNTQRVATVLLFLSVCALLRTRACARVLSSPLASGVQEVEEGGETVFPLKSEWADQTAAAAAGSFSEVRLAACTARAHAAPRIRAAPLSAMPPRPRVCNDPQCAQRGPGASSCILALAAGLPKLTPLARALQLCTRAQGMPSSSGRSR